MGPGPHENMGAMETIGGASIDKPSGSNGVLPIHMKFYHEELEWAIN